MNPRPTVRAPYRLGFTLIELLVVVAIIGLVSVIALSAILPAYRHRGITQGALLLNSVIVGAKDAAVRANAPRGFRLVQDPPQFNPATPAGVSAVTCSRMIPIELAPDYNEGHISFPTLTSPPPVLVQNLTSSQPNFAGLVPLFNTNSLYLRMKQEVIGVSGVANEPTEWFWNIRQGDRIRLNDSGRYMPIAGPMTTYTALGNTVLKGDTVINTERFINFDIPAGKNPLQNTGGMNFLFVSPLPPSTGPTAPGSSFQINNNMGPFAVTLPSGAVINPEFLLLVNGQDDDGDGFTDNSFDGIDNDGDGLIDPGFNGVDDDGDGVIDDFNELFLRQSSPGKFYWDTRLYVNRNAYASGSWPVTGVPAGYNPEYEPEGTPAGLSVGSIGSGVRTGFADEPYTILRRAVPTQGAREIQMPAGVVIDLTTADQYGNGERSRLPIDANTNAVDILITPSGTVLQAGANGLEAVGGPFYHFWICEREDVFAPPYPALPTTVPYTLPMPSGTPGYPAAGDTTGRVLKNEHRLITLFTKTGQVTTNTIDDFDATVPTANYGVNRPYIEAQLGLRETP